MRRLNRARRLIQDLARDKGIPRGMTIKDQITELFKKGLITKASATLATKYGTLAASVLTPRMMA